MLLIIITTDLIELYVMWTVTGESIYLNTSKMLLINDSIDY